MEDDDEVPQLVDTPITPAIQTTLNQADAQSNTHVTNSVASSATSTTSASSVASVASNSLPPVPLMILTGWLGAGKTTLLTNLLTHFTSRGQSIAIIQNETSSFGVEVALEIHNDEAGVFGDLLELSNGCICCSVKSDFVMACEELLKRKRFDYFIVECSGLADPGPLAQLFWVDPELESSIYLDAIVSVVDAKHFLKQLHSTAHVEEAQQIIHQVAYADRVILNKKDLVGAQELENCLHEIRKINTNPIFQTEKSQLQSFDDICFIKAFDVNDTSRSVVMPALESTTEQSPDAVSHPHDTSITSFMLDDLAVPSQQRKKVDLHKLKLWLAELLWQDVVEKSEEEKQEANKAAASASASSSSSSTASPDAATATASPASKRPNEMFRLKAILNFSHEDRPFFLQGVQQLYDLVPSEQGWPDLPRDRLATNEIEVSGSDARERFTRFIFIGRRLDHELLRAGFQSIFV